MVTQVEIGGNEKAVETQAKQVFLQLLRVLPNFHECYHNFMETRKESFLVLLKETRGNFLFP